MAPIKFQKILAECQITHGHGVATSGAGTSRAGRKRPAQEDGESSRDRPAMSLRLPWSWRMRLGAPGQGRGQAGPISRLRPGRSGWNIGAIGFRPVLPDGLDEPVAEGPDPC